MSYHKWIVLNFCFLVTCLGGLGLTVYAGGDPTCPGDAFPTRLPGGSQGFVMSSSGSVFLHDDPFRQEAVLGELLPGERFKVVDEMPEPTCAYEQLWIYVETTEGVKGWVTEVSDEHYLLEPLNTTEPLSEPMADIEPETFTAGRVDYHGVHFTFDKALATRVEAQFLPSSAEINALPPMLKFSLTPAAPGDLPFMTIHVMSAQSVNNLYPDATLKLVKFLTDAEAGEWPYDVAGLFNNAAVMSRFGKQIIPLGNGLAHRSVSHAGHDYMYPSDFLTYEVFGITDDGQYYIHASFITYYKDLTLFNPPTDDREDPNLTTLLEDFHKHIAETLTTAPERDFTPQPGQIDPLFATLIVDPGTLQDVIDEANVVGTGLVPTPSAPQQSPTPTATEIALLPADSTLQPTCRAISALDYIDEATQTSWTGEAFKLLGPETEVRIDMANAPDFGQGDMSFNLWIQRDASQFEVVFDRRISTETVQGIALFFTFDNAIGLQLADGPTQQNDYNASWTNYTSSVIVNDQAWHLITVTLDRDNPQGGKIYLDGQLGDTFDPTGRLGSLDAEAPLSLGQRSFSEPAYFYGSIKGLRFYPCLLTDAEIEQLAAGGGNEIDPPADLQPGGAQSILQEGTYTFSGSSLQCPDDQTPRALNTISSQYDVVLTSPHHVRLTGTGGQLYDFDIRRSSDYIVDTNGPIEITIISRSEFKLSFGTNKILDAGESFCIYSQYLTTLMIDVTATSTPQAVIAPTAFPTATSTPFPTYCPASPPSRIQVGIVAGVTHAVAGEVREDLRVRAAPNGDRIGAMSEGTQFRVIGGYECAGDRIWWQIETLDQSVTGWITEGATPDDYYIEPISN